METVFITIHDLSSDARIRYCSDSVENILGYLPYEVKGKPCWDFFHPDEIQFAKAVHDRGISLDKAAVFNYCRIKHKDGYWIGCECVFTIVYDVLVASTAIYQRSPKSRKRASDGASIRRIFSSAPRDPRYHMLGFISDKFYQEPQPHAQEPRAAMFLNRFTKTSTIMFATNGVIDVLGLHPTQLVGKSFYYCIAQNCLDDAIRCLENAKANDSIAYLRFWYRDPTHDAIRLTTSSATSSMSEDEDDDGGVSIISRTRSLSSARLATPPPIYDTSEKIQSNQPAINQNEEQLLATDGFSQRLLSPAQIRHSESQSRSSSDESLLANSTSRDAIFDPPAIPPQSSTSSMTPNEDHPVPLEIEAVVSCTSDGLVLVLRRARPLIPHTSDASDSPYFANGLFASPWAAQPFVADDAQQPIMASNMASTPVDESAKSGFMAAIRDVAVFAWSLTGINGSLVDHAHGTPSGEALPAGGLPVWDRNANVDPATNNRWNGFSSSTHRRIEEVDNNISICNEAKDSGAERESSDDEVLWKRAPQQPPWKRPKRKAHQDTFDSDNEADIEGKPSKDMRLAKSRVRKVGDGK